MPKSGTTEGADAQELVALRLDMEHVNTMTEEIGIKVDSVEGKITGLSKQVNCLEALMSGDRGRPVERDKSPVRQQPEPEVRGHSRPPHWRRHEEHQSQPVYENYQHNTHPETESQHPEYA
jgi:hypothetical protein